MKIVTTSAPGKLVLVGEHAVVYGYPCLVTAVTSRIKLVIEEITTKEVIINAPQMNIMQYRKPLSQIGIGDIPKEIRFVEIAIKNFAEKFPFFSGIKVTTDSEFSSKIGFGSSSAVTVACTKALSDFFGCNLSQKDIFDLSYKTVLEIQKKGSGVDVAAAVFGGILFFVTSGKIVENVPNSSFDFIVAYSGEKIDTVSQLEKVKKEADKNPEKIQNIYKQIEELVIKAKKAFEEENMVFFGECMNQNHVLLQELGVSNKKLDAMVAAAVTAGAYGAKLSGGGGDCMIAICAKEKRSIIESAITHAGGEIIHVQPNAQGVELEK